MLTRPHRWMVAVIIAVGGILPVGLYGLQFGRVPTVTPAEARSRLSDASGGVTVLDVRTPKEYHEAHLDGAVLWPLQDLQSGGPPPRNLQGRPLLVICRTGFRSVEATKLLRAAGYEATNIRGGMQEWIAFAPAMCIGNRLDGRSVLAENARLPYHQASIFEQWVAVITAFGVKPLYMLGSLLVAWRLRRSRSPDAVGLRWAMILFFAGELFCLLNYLCFNERSHLFEYLHGFGMALAFGFTAFAAIEFIDLRLMHYGDPSARCGANSLCRGCIKHAQVPCFFRRMFLLAVPAIAMMAAIPLCVPLRDNAYNTHIFGTLYSYVHPVVHQLYEVRFLPLAAIVLLLATFVAALVGRYPLAWAKVLFSAAMGAMGFSYFRMALMAPFAENQVWFGAWEELTEMVYIVAALAGWAVVRSSGRSALMANQSNRKSDPGTTVAGPSQR